MHTYRLFKLALTGLMLAFTAGPALTGSTVALAQEKAAPPPDQMEESPEAQREALKDAVNVPDPQERTRRLEQFLKEHPDTPFKAGVYQILFKSYGEFSQDHEMLWALGQQTLDAVKKQVETSAPPFLKNPVMAQSYNEVAYEFANRGAHLDGALDYAQQSLALVQQAATNRPPMATEAQWMAQMNELRGQILDTLGWIQFKRKALPDAEKALTEAIALLPEHGTLRYHLGQVYAASDQPEKAIDAYLVAVTVIQPDSSSQVELEKLYKTKYGSTSKSRLDAALDAARGRAQTQQKTKILAERLNQPASDFELETLTSGKVTLSSLKGKVVVVNFWATWCPPCREEMPKLQQVYEAYQGKDVAFLIASVDQEQEKVKPYIDDNHYTFPVYYGRPAAEQYEVDSIPTTFIIDKSGTIQFKHIGYRPDIRDVLGWEIDALLTPAKK